MFVKQSEVKLCLVYRERSRRWCGEVQDVDNDVEESTNIGTCCNEGRSAVSQMVVPDE